MTLIMQIITMRLPLSVSLVPAIMYCLQPASVATGSEMTRFESHFWRTLYQELHPGESPRWPKGGGPHAWATQEEERLEPIVVEILQGKRGEMPWTHGMIAAKVIPTGPIRDALSARLDNVLEEVNAKDGSWNSEDCASVGEIISILAGQEDARALKASNALVRASICPERAIRACLIAIRKIGNAESIDALRSMPSRRGNERVDRMAALTEMVIEARLEGKSVSPHAQEELTALVTTLLGAIERKDPNAYIALLPYGFSAVKDEDDVVREIFDNPEAMKLIGYLKEKRDAAFDMTDDGLEASLELGEGHRLECIFEVDGWKLKDLR